MILITNDANSGNIFFLQKNPDNLNWKRFLEFIYLKEKPSCPCLTDLRYHSYLGIEHKKYMYRILVSCHEYYSMTWYQSTVLHIKCLFFLILTAYHFKKKSMLSFNLLFNPHDRYQLLTLSSGVQKRDPNILIWYLPET